MGDTKNISPTQHETARRAAKARQHKNSARHHLHEPQYTTARVEEQNRRKAVRNTRDALTIKLKGNLPVLEIAEVMLDKYTSAVPIRTNGHIKTRLVVSMERTRSQYATTRISMVDLAIRAVCEELGFQLNLLPES